MSDIPLPNSWLWTTLGEICSHPQYGYTTKAAESGNTLFLRTTDITSGKIEWDTVPFCAESPDDPEKYQLYDGDIVISRAGSVGFSHLVQSPPKAVFASYLIRFRPFIDRHYFALFLKSPFYWRSISDSKSGIAVGNVNAQKLAAITIPLPPLPEQKRIVAKIEELFSELEAGEASLRKARRQLGVYRQSLLKQAFEGKLTQKWRTQNPDKLFSLDGIQSLENSPQLPEGWSWIKLGSAIEQPAYGTSKKCSYESDGVGVLRIPNVVNGAIDAADLKFAEFTGDEFNTYQLQEGDLLMIRSNGSVSIVGRCARVESKHTELLYAGYLIRLRPNGALLDSTFLKDQLASHAVRSQIEFSAKSTSGVNNINAKEIQRLVIALPSLPEQQEIVRLLEAQFEVIEQNERELDAALKRSDALRQSILKKAFSGCLVPQDSSNEPASELLGRIKAERLDLLPEKSKARLGRPSKAKISGAFGSNKARL